MPSDLQLADVLSEFAHTLLKDFPIQRILDRLVDRTVDILPITAAGVMVIASGPDPRYVAASDESALRFEELQSQLGEGPGLLAYQSGGAVAVPDLREDSRFPSFGRRALEAGLVAVFTFPLRHVTIRWVRSTSTGQVLDRWTEPPWTPLRRWLMSERPTCSTPERGQIRGTRRRDLMRSSCAIR